MLQPTLYHCTIVHSELNITTCHLVLLLGGNQWTLIVRQCDIKPVCTGLFFLLKEHCDGSL